MKISSYTQYYLRQLLGQFARQLDYPVLGVGIRECLQTDIHQVLKRLYPTQVEFREKLYELDRLAYLHQQGTQALLLPPQELAGIEQKIFWLMGLKSLAMLGTMSVKIVLEWDTVLFYFLLNDQMQQGVRYADQLYGRVLNFGADYDLRACQMLFKLNGQQIPFILTVSAQQHGIWVDLRSPAYRTLVKTKRPPLKQAS